MDQLIDVRRLLAAGVTVCAMGLAGVGTGCEALGGNDDDDNGATSGEVISGGGVRPSSVPAGARLVDSGTDDLSFTASAAGTAYVVDSTQGRLITSRSMTSGQRLLVEADQDRVALDGRPIYEQNLEKNNRHAIWFEASGATDGGTIIGNGWSLPTEMAGARLAASGMGEISYTAPSDGRVWVWDPRSRQIIHSADVDDGERILVSPRAGTVTVGQFKRSTMMDPDRSYEVYFDAH